MANLKRDEEFYSLLQPILQEFQHIRKQKKGNDIFLDKLSRYPDLVERAEIAEIYSDHMFADKKDIKKAYRSYLFDLKEIAAVRDMYGATIVIDGKSKHFKGIYDRLNENDTLRDKVLAAKERLRLPENLEHTLPVEGIFDYSLFGDRTNRYVTGKDGEQYLRVASQEVRRNELLRQLSDLPYEDVIDKVFDLREQLVELTGNDNYKIPATTYKREFVTLREEIGRKLAEKAGFSEEIAGLDQHYQYRFLTDRWNKVIEKSNDSTPVLSDFVAKQLRNLNSDVAVLNSYQTLVDQLKKNGIIASDIKVHKNMSVKDKIKAYRQQLGDVLKSNLDQVAGIVGKNSPAYLDLVESQKGDNISLYDTTVKELSKELGFSEERTDRLVKRKVPLFSWQQIADDVRARRSAEKERLFNGGLTSQSEFSEVWKSKGWVRRLVDYREVKKKDGTTVKIPNGVTKFKDSYYRDGIDDNALVDAREQEKQRLLRMSFEDFNKEYQSSREVRSLFPRTEITDTHGPVTSNGKPVTKPEGLTRFNGSWYRDGVDKDKLEKDFLTVVGDSEEKISAAKQKIVSAKKSRIEQLKRDIEDRKKKNLDTSKKEELLDKLKERLKAFENKDYSYDTVGSLDRRAAIIKAAAEELSVKANIMSFDPAFNFNRVLQGVNKDDRISALNTAVRDVLRDYSAVESFETRYQQQNFTVPSNLSVMSLERQLSWYSNADALMSDISSKDRDAFVSWMSGQKYGALSTQLPVGYLQRINGKVFRSVEDADIIADLNRKKELWKQQETRILTGPAAREKPQQLGAFGELLNEKVSVDDTALNKVSSLASDFSSEKYATLSDDEKKLFDRNFGKPVKEGNTYYRSIYDMPSDVWKRSEKAAGYDVPRSRNGVMPADFDIRVAEEEAFQKKLTEDLAARTWEPVKVAKSDKPSVPAPTEEPKVVTEENIVQQETKSNLRKMLSSADRTVRRNSIGTMGLLGALTLFNSAMAGPSDEAVAHKRKVEEERRIKMYGY